MTAHLAGGATVALAERCYLTRAEGETVLYGARTTEGRFVKASDIRWIS